MLNSVATDLVPGVSDPNLHVFVYDRRTGRTTLASTASDGTPANASSVAVAASRTSRFVPFSSGADNLVPGDTNGRSDAFVRDMRTGVTTRVSLTSTGGQVTGNSGEAMASANGRFVAFNSEPDTLVPGDDNNVADVFVRDTAAGITERVSVG